MFRPVKDRVEYGGCLIDQREVKAINKVIANQGGKRWTIGPNSVAFEKELAEKVGVKYSVVVNSGSSALLVAIHSLKLPKKAKVIIPALNFPTAYSSVLQAGYTPVVVDCDLTSLNLSLEEVEKAIKTHPDIKAVVAVHIAGNCVDLKKLRKIVKHRIIVSDNCDGLGGTLDGKYIDTYSDVSCVSFHAAHIISMGEGGAVLTNNEKIATTARKMREWGRASGSDTLTKHKGFPPDYRERYVFDEMGWNLKPLELQCAMGRVQLTKLEKFKKMRLKNYKRLLKGLKGTKLEPIEGDDENCWFSFPLLTKERPRVMEVFEKNNIETRTIFSGNILRHPAYSNKPYIRFGHLSNSNRVMKEGMFLSVHPSLLPEMVDYMIKVAHEI